MDEMYRPIGRRAALGGLAGLAVFGAVPTAFAEDGLSEKSDEEVAQELIDDIDRDLAAKGTSVAEQLSLMETETGLSATNYTTYDVSENDILRTALGSFVAAFAAANLKLSSELLLRSMRREKGVYVPRFGSRANGSPVVKRLLKAGAVYNSGKFEINSGGPYASDLYYAIHAFNSKKSSMKNAKTLTITDRYDFAPEKYKGLKAGAVNTVHLAQKRGVAQEYNLRIVAS